MLHANLSANERSIFDMPANKSRVPTWLVANEQIICYFEKGGSQTGKTCIGCPRYLLFSP